MNGDKMSSLKFSLAPNSEQDIAVHDMQGFALNSYGRVCSTHSGSAGEVEGRMVYYKQNAQNFTHDNAYAFAFVLPFSNGAVGKQYVPYNTFQPSLNVSDTNVPVPNWIQISNNGTHTVKGKLKFFSAAGVALGGASVTLPAGARSDFPAHQFGANSYGLAAWIPEHNNRSVQMRNIRYFRDNTEGADSFHAAFGVEASRGNGELLALPIDTQDASSVIELTNTLGQKVNIRLKVYNKKGQRQHSSTLTLSARSTSHIDLNPILQDGTGLVTIDGTRTESIIAHHIVYGRDSDGHLLYSYANHAQDCSGSELRGSYNTFIDQQNRLLLGNPTNEVVTVTLSLKRADRTNVLQNYNRSIPPHGMVSVKLNSFESDNQYGTVTVTSNTAHSIVGVITRERKVATTTDYIFSTPLR